MWKNDEILFECGAALLVRAGKTGAKSRLSFIIVVFEWRQPRWTSISKLLWEISHHVAFNSSCALPILLPTTQIAPFHLPLPIPLPLPLPLNKNHSSSMPCITEQSFEAETLMKSTFVKQAKSNLFLKDTEMLSLKKKNKWCSLFTFFLSSFCFCSFYLMGKW